MAESKHTGGCMCGEIRFESTSPPTTSTICYCEYCRHAVGAAAVAWLTFRAEDFAFTRGKPATYPSSRGVQRTFCPKCGTSLTYTNEGRKTEIDVTTGSMDRPEAYPLTGIVFPAHRVSWDVPPAQPVLHDDGRAPISWPPSEPL